MRLVMFYHSLVSDWNHGNAHFLRGVCCEFLKRGFEIRVFEPADAWSYRNLVNEHGEAAIEEFRRAYPELDSIRYDPRKLRLDDALDGADLVIAHEWNSPELISELGRHRARDRSYFLLFHDTHHRLVTDMKGMEVYDLSHFDGVLAYGRVLRDLYLARGYTRRAWTWHEAADATRFKPYPDVPKDGDLVWIGNWGDEERAEELQEFLIEPVSALGLRARVYGVRYPDRARRALDKAGIEYCGWLPNHQVPQVFARHRFTVHIPRRPYVRSLPGIPTVRPFEAMACGIPLVCSPWHDVENLFHAGHDYLVAEQGQEMGYHLAMLMRDDALRDRIAQRGLETIRTRHTCAQRVDQLLEILKELKSSPQPGVTQSR